ncbi:hypothetical protein ACFUMH_10350 [Cellulomonas sp. NPDC057328]|uniref:hypothetical protein n=1 Tax=Cellulomonas sp. NPDC057328 TaxID=3346101 RepID=UPI003636EF53
MSGPWPDHPGVLSRLVRPPELRDGDAVSYVDATCDARSAGGRARLDLPLLSDHEEIP